MLLTLQNIMFPYNTTRYNKSIYNVHVVSRISFQSMSKTKIPNSVRPCLDVYPVQQTYFGVIFCRLETWITKFAIEHGKLHVCRSWASSSAHSVLICIIRNKHHNNLLLCWGGVIKVATSWPIPLKFVELIEKMTAKSGCAIKSSESNTHSEVWCLVLGRSVGLWLRRFLLMKTNDDRLLQRLAVETLPGTTPTCGPSDFLSKTSNKWSLYDTFNWLLTFPTVRRICIAKLSSLTFFSYNLTLSSLWCTSRSYTFHFILHALFSPNHCHPFAKMPIPSQSTSLQHSNYILYS